MLFYEQLVLKTLAKIERKNNSERSSYSSKSQILLSNEHLDSFIEELEELFNVKLPEKSISPTTNVTEIVKVLELSLKG